MKMEDTALCFGITLPFITYHAKEEGSNCRNLLILAIPDLGS
jgi:hypothetical protein